MTTYPVLRMAALTAFSASGLTLCPPLRTWTIVTGNGWSTTDATTATGWENQAMFDLNDEALPVVGAYAAR